ncbi:3-deoxy-D-manno-octulosonic-acid transferase [Gemmobacter megaterium]|uniref:3-deoxy-D-manno-octulosonic acid transferase n=1 Tax=Gemmobacter megaterium TaxID=1086013 RepID=A0A1N7QDX7_9RHOB|nr:glycosyltransferase N-terminal domain-containing protein [Gemmobacter megaterium]SIT21006.1 3-deoxy-D-manno-octulosonic-acid transferase [Gemmobacter megaterium]
MGRVAWLHAPAPPAARGLGPLAQGLIERGLVDAAVVTCAELGECPGGTVVPPPSDRPKDVAAFLDHWRPDIGIWADGGLRPVLLHTAAARGLPMILVDGRAPDLPGAGWWLRLMPGLMAPFRHVLVQDDTARRLFLRAGASADAVQVTGPLEVPSRFLSVNEAERAALARTIGTRPVWLAMGVPEGEEDAIAAAHLSALRSAHRLLLILVPDSLDRAAALSSRFSGQFGLETARRSCEDEPNEDAQVYLADTDGELGLWYRLAPMTWCGGTLTGPGPLRHPFEAAAMGSAIIHGLETGPETESFERLRRAGASRVVRAPADLGDAVGELLSTDRCARLAQAAWTVSSAGAEATQLALDMATQMMKRPKG